MSTLTTSTEEEINKAIYEVANLIQNLCKSNSHEDVLLLVGLVQSAANLVQASKSFMD
jgi:mannose/fructose/N-acetylgalactosamine-specific phosphotransferase system component IIB